MNRHLKIAASFLFALFLASPVNAAVISDDAGQILDFDEAPRRVVSLVPAATEIICALGSQEHLAGVTYHDTNLAGAAGLPVVGGANSPQFALINYLQPDLVIVTPRTFELAKEGRGPNGYPIMVWDDAVTLDGADERTIWLGEVLGKEDEAEQLVAQNRELMTTIVEKLDKIPPEKRPRVMNLLNGPDTPFTYGTKSFHNEVITLAGGLPPALGENPVLPVSLSEWQSFNPQVVFACGPAYEALTQLLSGEGWNTAEAVKNGRVYSFPCEMTDRAAANTGEFVAWLAATIYGDQFLDKAALVRPEEIISQRAIDIGLAYVEKAAVVESRVMDFANHTLLIEFKTPQNVISTAEGGREQLQTIGISSSPPSGWTVFNKMKPGQAQTDLAAVLNLDLQLSALMTTRAATDNMAVARASTDSMTAVAVVTATVEQKAMRTTRENGAWYEPASINIIVMTSHKLTRGQTARALATITEAKTAALWDMDIRSVRTPLVNPATGTGTDDIMVVEGEGAALTAESDLSAMAELIAGAVHKGVQEALWKQHGKVTPRSIFERLSERGLMTAHLLGGPDYPFGIDPRKFQSDMEILLMSPRYRGFLELAFAVSDARNSGQLTDLEAFNILARQMASEIAGTQVRKIEDITAAENLPPVLKTALNALGTGLKYKKR
ncbi:hypothetical protein C4J81_18025 [Deltaproteobacteria bacterium Smac51]|nr:hypothetical protein C4J81_18025 [Deltaproteobacteria bacterium Smac51]